MDSAWCEPLRPQLSQGDILKEVPFWSIRNPATYLEKRTEKGNRAVWVEVPLAKKDGHGNIHVLNRSHSGFGLVISHDCELDKQKQRRRVQAAMLIDVASLNPDEREKVLGSRSHSRMVLPDLPNGGKTLYADFRAIVTLDRELIDGCERIASLADPWVTRLQAQIVAFFTRLELPT